MPSHKLYIRAKRGALIIEIIAAFTLFMITAVGIAQYFSIRARASLETNLETHLNRQLHIIGGYLASYRSEGPIFSDPILDTALGWSRLRVTDSKTDESHQVIGDRIAYLPIIMEADGTWIYPLPTDLDLAITEGDWLALAPSDRRRAYWNAAGQSPLTLAVGGGGTKTRTLADGTIRRGQGLPYTVQLFQEVTYLGDLPLTDWYDLELSVPSLIPFADLLVAFRLRAELDLAGAGDREADNPLTRSIVVENVYSKVN